MAEDIQYIDPPQEPLTPREQRLERGAAILRGGAIANAGLVLLILIAALIGGLRLVPDFFLTLQGLLLARMSLAADTAVAVVIFLMLVNISLLLVLMVGVLAREVWVLGAIWIVTGVNALALLLGFTPAIVSIIAAGWAGAVITRDVPAFRLNPVMLKELRGRMRGMRAFIVLTVYLGLMGAFTALLYVIYTASTVQATGSAAIGSIGRVLFIGLVGIELLLIIFIAPAFTAGAITGERERLTYDLLRTTLLASPSFVIGKLNRPWVIFCCCYFRPFPCRASPFSSAV